MPILNYTTTVDVAKSIGEIQAILIRFGARSVVMDYDDNGNVSGIGFVILINGLPLSIRIPCNVDGVFESLCQAPKVPNKSKTRIQARRVAWRILKDWLEAQFALYEIGQAEIGQVLMPYATDSEGRTAYQMFKESHIRQLGAASDNVVEGKFAASSDN